MTIREAKTWGIKELRKTGDEAAISAEILLAHALGITREEILAHDERNIPPSSLTRFRRLIGRRKKHEPVAYLTGHREFFGLKFTVNKHVLVPRPETEMLVEEVLARTPQPPTAASPLLRRGANPKPLLEQEGVGGVIVIDVGTGSGAIAVSVAKNSEAAVIATDISAPALKVAQRNAAMNGVEDRIVFRRSDLIGVLKRPLQNAQSLFIAANLPYIPTADWRKCMPDVKKFEPRTALDGGKDGLKFYDQLFRQIIGFDIKPTAIICEIDPSQKKSFPRLAKKHFPSAKTEMKSDLAGLPRLAIITFPTHSQ